jgi:hypothetical protein
MIIPKKTLRTENEEIMKRRDKKKNTNGRE